MTGTEGFFNIVADSIVRSVTYFVNSFSGFLQLTIYFLMSITFIFAITKAYKAFRLLGYCDPDHVLKRCGSDDFHGSIKTPLSIIAAGFFKKTKKHYTENGESGNTIPPDAFIRDAAFQFSERYFSEKFLEPISMTANLLPPLGFIGTIVGMVIHFLSNSGSLNTNVTTAGIATALYTTLIALMCYTFLEFSNKTFFSLSQKRIDEGLSIISDNMINFSAMTGDKDNNEA